MELVKSIIVSRHNLRFPLDFGFDLDCLSGNGFVSIDKWDDLTGKGKCVESQLGAFFRQKLFIDFPLSVDDLYCVSNDLNRTIDTANYFFSGFGLQPKINIDSEVFSNSIKMSGDFSGVYNDFLNCFSENFSGLYSDFKDELLFLDKLFDFRNSLYARETGIDSLFSDNVWVDFVDGRFVKIPDIFWVQNILTDALVCKYLDDYKNVNKLFNLSISDFKKIMRVCEIYPRIISTPRKLARNVSSGFVNLLLNELLSDNKFCFFSCHDINIMILLTLLGADNFNLVDNLYCSIPFGAKLVFNLYKNDNKDYFIKMKFVYPSATSIMRNWGNIDILTTDVSINNEFLINLKKFVNILKN